METVELVGRKLELDADGHLKNLNDWDKEVAAEFARLEGIEELTDRHWLVIEFMRKEFKEKGDAPSIRKLTKESGVETKECKKQSCLNSLHPCTVCHYQTRVNSFQ